MKRTVIHLGVVGLAVGLAAACGSDDENGSADSDSGVTVDGGNGSNGGGSGGSAPMDDGSVDNGGSGGSAGSAGSVSNDDGGVEAGPGPGIDGGAVAFVIPAGGGSVPVFAGGIEVQFTFPASAEGVEVTLTPSSGSALGFADGDFDAVIQLTPTGTVFADPVIVTPSDPTQSPLLFAGDVGPMAAEPMPYNVAEGGFELTHFSYVGFSGYWCDTLEEWTAGTDPNSCTEFAPATEDRHLNCVANKFCISVTQDCCEDPNGPIGTGCSSNGPAFSHVVTRSNDTSGGLYPYCDISSLIDGGAGGLTCDEAFSTLAFDAGFAPAYRCTDTLSPAWMNGECEGGIPPGWTCDEFCALMGTTCRGAALLDRGACNGGGNAFSMACNTNQGDVYCSCGGAADAGL